MDVRDTAEIPVGDLTLAQAASLFPESAVHFTATMGQVLHFCPGISPDAYWTLTVAEHVAIVGPQDG